jgi:hypothetical protein
MEDVKIPYSGSDTRLFIVRPHFALPDDPEIGPQTLILEAGTAEI